MIPDFQTIMLPLLRLAGDGAVWQTSDARDRLAHEFIAALRSGIGSNQMMASDAGLER